MKSPLVETERGFVIVRENGRVVDGSLYANRKDAAMVCAFLNGCTPAPARRVTSFRKSGGTTLALRSEIILDTVERAA